MDYKKYIELIEKVTGFSVPVIYNDFNANCMGSCYVGFTGFEDIIAPDFFLEDDGFFEFEDFLEPEHLQYYHVGLQTKIVKGRDKDFFDIFSRLVTLAGVDVSEKALEVFVMLHEFGHAHLFLIEWQGDLCMYGKDILEHRSHQYMARHCYESMDGYQKYREIPSEAYADNYAIKYLKQVMELIDKEEFNESISLVA